MGDFFKGWQRKAGLASLAITLALMAGWVRSYVVMDGFWIEQKEIRSKYLVDSFQGRIGLERTVGGLHGVPFKLFSWRLSKIADNIDDDGFPFWHVEQCDVIEWHAKWAGFNFGSARYRQPFPVSRIDFWHVPYWSVVWPLTLLSAWLILAKPRKAKTATGITS